MPVEHSSLTKFLLDPKNSVTRERLLYHRLCADLYASAARAQYPLTVFSPEVDRDGYDLVLDDSNNEYRVQLKSMLSVSSTRVWKTTKRFLRPGRHFAGWHGFKLSPKDEGVGGGIVLIECDSRKSDLPVTYRFTDLLILASIQKKWIPGKAAIRAQRNGNRTPSEQARDLILSLKSGSGSDPIKVPFGVFVTAASPDALAEIIGLHALGNTSLRYQINLRLRDKFDAAAHRPLEQRIQASFEKLTTSTRW